MGMRALPPEQIEQARRIYDEFHNSEREAELKVAVYQARKDPKSGSPLLQRVIRRWVWGTE